MCPEKISELSIELGFEPGVIFSDVLCQGLLFHCIIYHNLVNHFSIVEHLSYFQFLVNNTIMNILFKKKFLMFIFERERQSMSRGGAERGGDTESEAGSRL